MSQARAKQGGILLFHDIHQNTVDQLPTIIDALLAEGFSFVNLNDTSTFPLLNGVRPKFVGDSCEADEGCDFVAGGVSGHCLSWDLPASATAGFCSISCQGYCPDKGGKAPTFCVSLDSGQTGQCVSKSHGLNEYCAAIEGTAAVEAERFVGESSALPSTATVCLPE